MIIVFLVALFFAYMLSPAVNALDRKIPPRVSRNWSLVIVYLVFVGALIGIGFAIGSTVVEQASNLAARLPELIKSKRSVTRVSASGMAGLRSGCASSRPSVPSSRIWTDPQSRF